MRTIFALLKRQIDVFAPYMVYNSETLKEHYCWTLKDVIEWLDCYDANDFGVTVVINRMDKVIFSKAN